MNTSMVCALLIAGAFAVGGLSACGDAGPSTAAPWPRQFVAFSFSSDVIVTYPATCRTFDFSYDTNPQTSIDELEVTIDEGSMTVHTVQALAPNASANSRLEGHGVWRVCAGDDAPLEGKITVRFKDRPEYFAETRLVQRNGLEDYRDDGPRLVLPTRATYPSDLRFSNDGMRIEVATGEGLILHFDAATGIVLRSENIVDGGIVFIDETRVLNDENDRNRQRFVDRANRKILSSVGLHGFVDLSGSPGDLMYGHAGGRTFAIIGGGIVGDHHGPAMVATFDLDRQDAFLHELGYPLEYRLNPNSSHFPQVVVAPNGRRIAWSGLGAPAEGDLPDRSNQILDLDTDTRCSYFGSTILRGQNEPINIAIPAFSSDSAWLAHWASRFGAINHSRYPIVVFDAATCELRAYSEDTPPSFHRGGVAIARGGELVAATSQDDVILYEVPPGPNAQLIVKARMPSARTTMLNAGTQSADFSDRVLFKRFRYRYPVLRFSDDGTQLVSASNAAVRLYAVDNPAAAPESAIETPEIDTSDYEVWGDYLRVGVLGQDGQDLIYAVTPNGVSFVYRLAAGEEFVGIDQYGVLVSRVDGRYVRRVLSTRAVEDAGEEEPAWNPAFSAALTVHVTDRGLEVTR